MEFTDPYFLTLKKINRFARAVQDEIQRFQPDLLIVLARGGFGPLWALEAVWEESKADHPPVLVTNLGREKLLRYEYHRAAIGIDFWTEVEPFQFYGSGERGYFLVWLSQQLDWRGELRQQVEACLGTTHPPERILVIDDTVLNRYTTLIALGLLLAEFPETDTRMMAGNLPDWRPDLAAPWLAEQVGRLPVLPDARSIEDCVYNLAPGASDTDRSSLQWEPISASSPSMQNYGKYLSVETWLQLPVWLKAQIQTFVRQTTDNDGSEEKIRWSALEPEEIAFRARWLCADFAPDEAAHELGMRTTQHAVELLNNLANRKA